LAPPKPKTSKAANLASDDMDIDDIIAAIKGDDDPKKDIPAHSPMKVPADAKCAHCGNSVRRGEDGIWVRTGGLLHPKCFEAKYGKSEGA